MREKHEGKTYLFATYICRLLYSSGTVPVEQSRLSRPRGFMRLFLSKTNLVENPSNSFSHCQRKTKSSRREFGNKQCCQIQKMNIFCSFLRLFVSFVCLFCLLSMKTTLTKWKKSEKFFVKTFHIGNPVYYYPFKVKPW